MLPHEVLVEGSGRKSVDGKYLLWPMLISGMHAWAHDTETQRVFLHRRSGKWRLTRCSKDCVAPAREMIAKPPKFTLRVKIDLDDPFEPYPDVWKNQLGVALPGLRVFPQAMEATEFNTLDLHGIRCILPRSETFIGKEVLKGDSYKLKDITRSDDIFLDIGAHCGLSSLKALACGCARVICVEPVSSTFTVLLRNLWDHVFKGQAVLLQKAVAPIDHEVVCMHLHRGTAGRDGRAFFNSAFTTRPHEEQPEYVEGISLTSLVQAYNPTILKVDAEGAERYLSSLDRALFRNIRLVIGEYDFTHNPGETEFMRFEQALRQAGFRRERMSNAPDYFVEGKAVYKGARGANTGMLFRWRKRCFEQDRVAEQQPRKYLRVESTTFGID